MWWIYHHAWPWWTKMKNMSQCQWTNTIKLFRLHITFMNIVLVSYHIYRCFRNAIIIKYILFSSVYLIARICCHHHWIIDRSFPDCQTPHARNYLHEPSPWKHSGTVPACSTILVSKFNTRELSNSTASSPKQNKS